MAEPREFEGIEKALDEGLEIMAFCASGNVRVATIDSIPRGKDNKAYGEHPTTRGALAVASEDYQGREHPESNAYVFGQVPPEDKVDWWVIQGRKIFARKTDGFVTLEATDFRRQRVVASSRAPTFQEAYKELSQLMIDIYTDERAGVY